jgi:hypothetical protein
MDKIDVLEDKIDNAKELSLDFMVLRKSYFQFLAFIDCYYNSPNRIPYRSVADSM